MRRFRTAALTTLSALIAVMALLLSFSVMAQEGGDPVPYTPDFPLPELTATRVPPNPNGCYDPLPLSIGAAAYIKPGVNIRSEPSQSAALMWNTVYENRTAEGQLIAEPLAVPVTIVDGPVCSQGYNWWYVRGTGNPGWVAEGTPYDNGYFIIVPGMGAPSGCDMPHDFSPGEEAEVRYNVRIREAPSLEGRTKTIVPFDGSVTIISGPECVEDLLWWYVRATVVDFTYEGWMAQGTQSAELIEAQDITAGDGTVCANPLPFFVGMRGFVDYYRGQPKSLRVAPDMDSTLLFSLVRGVPFIIENGPICADELNWWQIRVLASREVVGWMAEGSPHAGYWMVEVDPDEFAEP